VSLKLVGEISLDGSGWKRGLDRAGMEAGNFSKSALGGIKGAIAGAFSVGAISALAKKTVEYAGHINDLADRLGVTTDYLQEMQFVTKQNGGSVDDLTATFEKLGAARVEALSGNLVAQQSFKTLGISDKDLKTKGTSDLMDTIADKFKQFGNSDALKTAFKTLGGKGAGVLVPSFIDGIKEGRKAAQDAGAVIKEDSILQIDAIGDKFDELSIEMMNFAAPAILSFADALKVMLDQLQQTQEGIAVFLGDLETYTGRGNAQSRPEANANRDVQFARLQAQLDRKVAAGTMTQEQADQRIKKEKGVMDFSVGNTLNHAIEAMQTTADQQSGTEAAAAAARAAKIAERAKTAGSAPVIPAEPVSMHLRSADSLVSVGNFLGQNSGASMIEQIAKKQLVATEQTNTLLKTIADSNALGIPHS